MVDFRFSGNNGNIECETRMLQGIVHVNSSILAK